MYTVWIKVEDGETGKEVALRPLEVFTTLAEAWVFAKSFPSESFLEVQQ